MKSNLLFVAGCLLVFAGCQLQPPPVVQFVNVSAVTRVGTSVGLRVIAAEVNHGSIAVRFDWGDGDTSDWSPNFTSESTFTGLHAWSDTGRMSVLVQARTRSGVVSDWRGLAQVVVLDSARVRWVFPLGAGVGEAPAVGPDGTVYVVTSGDYGDCELVAVTGEGAEKWRFKPAADCRIGLPVVGEDGTVFVVSGRLEALGSDGQVRWSDPVDAGDMRAPALGPDGAVYFAHRDTAIALNADLSRRWATKLPGTAFGWPSVGENGAVVYCCHDTWATVALDADGAQRWRADGPSGAPSAGPERGVLLAVSYDIKALDSAGAALWSHSLGETPSEPSVAGDTCICVRTSSALRLLNPDGSSRSTLHEEHVNPGTTPVLDSHGAVCLRAGTRIVSRPLDSLSLSLWELDPGEYGSSECALAPNGMLYVAAGYELFAINNGAGPEPGVWPQFRHDARHTGCAAGGVR
jgi:outer membrane protein assembly factor BamB